MLERRCDRCVSDPCKRQLVRRWVVNEAVRMGLHAEDGFECRSGLLQAHPLKHKPQSLRRHPLNHKHPYPDQRSAHRGFMQQLYQREEGNKPASFSLFPMFHAWQHLIMNTPQPGMGARCSACAGEKPCSAQILISALILLGTEDIAVSGNGHRPPLCLPTVPGWL